MSKKIISILMSITILTMSLCGNLVPVIADTNTENLAAFPGAEGGGMYTQGARASSEMEVFHVVNLSDGGIGSFRDAVSQDNRIIVFDVAGNINLLKTLKITASNLTILGQTAPGEGICIGGEGVLFNGSSNIILRYLRFRTGDNSLYDEDGLGFTKCTDVIVDHCSISWSIDECLSAYANKNFTAQYCIISESLNNSVHGKGAHGYGGIWGGINASFHHNLIATHDSRNPRIGTSATVNSYNDTPDYESLVDIRNNVFYNWGKNSGYGGENNVRVNFVNNYYKPSQYSKVQRFFEFYGGDTNQSTTLHLSGNVMEGNDSLTNDNWLGLSTYQNGDLEWTKCEDISNGYTDSSGFTWQNDQYIYDYPVTTDTAEQAYSKVLASCGASVYRDSIDERVVNDVINKTVPTGSVSGAGIIDSQDDVGGWIALYGTKSADADNDGMPDEWENENGLNPYEDDSKDIAANGYTNIENYANYVADTTYEGYGVDSSALKSEINIASALDERGFSAEDWTIIQNAISAASKVYNMSAPTQAQIDEAYYTLKDVVDNHPEDFTSLLTSTLENAKSYYNTELYTYSSLSTLKSAIEKAEADLAAQNTDNYLNDADGLELAVNLLAESTRTVLKKEIEAIKKMDLSHLIQSDIDSINAVIDSAENVYNTFESSESDLIAAEEKIAGIIALKCYTRIYNGTQVECMDFENGVWSDEGYSVTGDDAEVNLAIVDNYTDNSTKNLSTYTQSKKYTFAKSLDLSQYNHFMISVDAASIGNVEEYISLYGENIDEDTKYYFGYSNYIDNGVKTALDTNISQLMRTAAFQANIAGKWITYSLEVNKAENEITYYINNLPIAKGTINSDSFKNYGFKITNNRTAYYDNIKLIDLDMSKYILPGDADYDNKLTMNDAAQLIQYILNDSYTTQLQQSFGKDALQYIDMDCNGKLDSADCAYIIQKVLDSTFTTPVDDKFATTEASTESTTETTTESATESTTETTTKYAPDETIISSTAETTTEATTEGTTVSHDYSFDFDDLALGSYTEDYKSGIFSIIAGDAGYSVKDDGNRYIQYGAVGDYPYITIDLPVGSTYKINFTAGLAGYSYSNVDLINTADNSIVRTLHIMIVTGKFTAENVAGGEYVLKASAGLKPTFYEISVDKIE